MINAFNKGLHNKWFKEIADQGKEYTQNEIKAYCEYHYALPIALRDPDDAEMLANVNMVPYETRLKIFENFDFEITEDFTDAEKEEYLNAIWSLGWEQGYQLTKPEGFY